MEEEILDLVLADMIVYFQPPIFMVRARQVGPGGLGLISAGNSSGLFLMMSQ